MTAQYTIYKSTNGQFYFNLTAENNEKILTSETYLAKTSAIQGIQSCKMNSPLDNRYFRYTAVNGQFYFLLKAANNETIGKSEMYNSTSARENGIQAVKRVGPTAPTKDLT